MDTDVVIVGGGIAGSTLAIVLARAGVEVVVLERQRRFADRVRGENLHPWGVAEARHLGILDVLLAAGGHVVEEVVDYGDGDDPDAAEAAPLLLSHLFDDVPGEVNLAHPAACEALAAAATNAGAEVLRGVSHVEVGPGTPPQVSYRLDGAARQLTCRLVVGADGRSSRVRRQTGIRLQRASGTHLIAGLLLDDLDIDPRRNVVSVGEDVWMVTFPQGAGRARVYLCPGTEDPQRYTGAEGIERFLTASCFDAVPGGQLWAQATTSGPCRTFTADDTWTDRPFAEGVVLIGDAAGYNDPLIGQGLALALRDVRTVSEQLLSSQAWDVGTFLAYGTERAERLRRMRFIAQLQATELTTFGEQGRQLRRGIRRRIETDPELLAGAIAMFVPGLWILFHLAVLAVCWMVAYRVFSRTLVQRRTAPI
jgi:2-polyprenyl-6-methoxyphenol hydroxylase-like FAD-dependent oxidoreductase